MGVVEGLRTEFEYEAGLTRELIARVPDEHWDYRPHEKSMSMGRLASHLAESLQWVEGTVQHDVLVMDLEQYQPYSASNREELLRGYDRLAEEASAVMGSLTDGAAIAEWRMEDPSGNVMMRMPRIAVLNTFVIKHMVHHRGQLTVYLRMKDVPLPAIYGPSADEQPIM